MSWDGKPPAAIVLERFAYDPEPTADPEGDEHERAEWLRQAWDATPVGRRVYRYERTGNDEYDADGEWIEMEYQLLLQFFDPSRPALPGDER
jgi:hypothetical protein